MGMERRKSRRFNVFFNTGLVSGSESYAGFAGNLSENGLYMRISSADSKIIFSNNTVHDLRLMILPDEALDICCRLVWSYEIPKDNLTGKSAYNLGMEILTPLPKYNDFYGNLAVENLNEYIKRYFH